MPSLAPALLSSDCSCSSSCNLPISRGSRLVRPAATFSRFTQKQPQVGLFHQTPRRVVKSAAAIHDSLPCTSEVASLYAILGLEQDVSHAEVKSAYRQMARRYHPDVCGEVEREESIHKFLEVQKAYEILSDPERRAEYDYSLLHPFCAQALGRGFASNMEMSGRPRRGAAKEAEDGVSVGWKLQWEAQLSRLKQRQQSNKSSTETESWGSKMRRANCWASEICAE